MTEQEIKRLVTHFPSYVDYIWKCINLPEATPVQKDIAKTLQEGHKRLLIEAFRGIGKTYTTGAYATWRLLRNPNEKVLIVSASGGHATAISTFIHKLLNTVPLLEHLKPRADQRNSVMAFDVNGAEATVQPSVKCLGITSQLQGNRASILISDDVETSINSATEVMRSKIIEQINEFDSILQTDADSCIIGLGTPQTGDSVYNRFADKGFLVRIWPSRIPENPELYQGRLAPYIEDMIMNGAAAGDVTDTRFTHEDLLSREVSVGKSYYRLQYQLDTTLSDANKYPLRQNDMIVMDVDKDKAPISVSYSSARSNIINEISNIGFSGDCCFNPGYIDNERAKYDFSIMSIDPSGRGSDEMGYAVLKYLNGKIYVVDVGGLTGGYHNDNLFKLARIAQENKVNTIYIENNFGDGMFNELLKPVLKKIHPAAIEEVRSSKQKELRIIDTLEPLLNQHRLVFDKGLLLRDIKEAITDQPKLAYSLVYQLTHITKDRGCLRHDDRLDALAIAAAAITEIVGVDEDDAKESYLQEQKETMLEDWIDSHSDSLWFSKNR
jgi:hypothetical protein